MKPMLLAIDLQEDFPILFRLLKSRPLFEESVRQLASLFRTRGLPVVHLLTRHLPDRSTWTLQMRRDDFRICIEGTEGERELDAVGRRPGELVLYKTRWSAFHGTELDRVIRESGCDSLVLAGFMTHACIRVTALDAYQRDYRVIIARDCVDTYDPLHERVTLEYLGRYVARVLTNREIAALIEPP